MKPICLFIALLTAATAMQAQEKFEVLNTPTQNTFVASSFINDSDGWIADNTGVLWHTKDGGATLDHIYEGASFMKLDFTDASNGFATGGGSAYKTTDGGATWQPLQLENAGPALYFLDKNTGFISGLHSIYKTTDGGASWITIDIAVRSFVDYQFINAGIGIATAEDFADNQTLWRTTDGGASWQGVFNDYHYQLNTVFFLNEQTGWTAGYYDQGGSTHEPVILKSIDAGASWQEIYHNREVMGLGETFTDLHFKNDLEGFAVSNLFVNVVTLDGGVTWNRADEDTSFTFPEFDGYYKSLAGVSDLYLTGTGGYLAVWK